MDSNGSNWEITKQIKVDQNKTFTEPEDPSRQGEVMKTRLKFNFSKICRSSLETTSWLRLLLSLLGVQTMKTRGGGGESQYSTEV